MSSNSTQSIADLHEARRRTGGAAISFEFFPPKTSEGERLLTDLHLPKLMNYRPDYFSVTYGAGGSTRDKTLSMVETIQKTCGVPGMAHLTCVDATQEQIAETLDEAATRGIQNILALRGDPPGGVGEFKQTKGGFEYSYQLVEFIRNRGGFCIGVAGFPEGHIACKEGRRVDWERLKHKIDSGADFVITQLFFDNSDFFEFRDYLRDKLSVKVPIIPGILPILSAAQIRRFTTLCGASIPEEMARALEKYADDDEAARGYGVEHASRQCRELLEAGVEGIHFYTLNKSESTGRVLDNLGLPGGPQP